MTCTLIITICFCLLALAFIANQAYYVWPRLKKRPAASQNVLFNLRSSIVDLAIALLVMILAILMMIMTIKLKVI